MSSTILLRNVQHLRAVLPASRLYHSGKAASVNTAIARGLRKSKGLAFRGSSSRPPKANDPREKFIERNGLVRRSADPSTFRGPQVARDGQEGRPKKEGRLKIESTGGHKSKEFQPRIHRGIKLIKTNEQLARKKPDPAGPSGSGRHGRKPEGRRMPFDKEERRNLGPRKLTDRFTDQLKGRERGADRGSSGSRVKLDYSLQYPSSSTRSPSYYQRSEEQVSAGRSGGRSPYEVREKSDFSTQRPSSSTRSSPYQHSSEDRGFIKRREDRSSYEAREESDTSTQRPSSSESSSYDQRDNEWHLIEEPVATERRITNLYRDTSNPYREYPTLSRGNLVYKSTTEQRGTAKSRYLAASRALSADPNYTPDTPTSHATRETGGYDLEKGKNRGSTRGPSTYSSGSSSTESSTGSSQFHLPTNGPGTHGPLSIPYTTTASEFLYGTSSVVAALEAQKGRGRRRQLYKLYIYQGQNRQNPERDANLERLAKQCGVKIQPMTGVWLRLMDKMSKGRPHNGYVLEVSPLPRPQLASLGAVTERDGEYGFKVELDYQSREVAAIDGSPDFIKLPGDRFGPKPMVLFLDGIQDPGNLGGILRTASFMGASAVAISTRRSAMFTPIVTKASAGASENMTLFRVDSPEKFISQSKLAGWKVYSAVAPVTGRGSHRSNRSVAVSDIGNPLANDPCILMLGSEGEGQETKMKKLSDVGVYIPSYGSDRNLDSLNVSVAAGIICNSFLGQSKTRVNKVKQVEGAGLEQSAASEPVNDLF